MSVVWVFEDHFEAWHERSQKRCITYFYQPPPIPIREVDKKPDARKLPRSYHHCRNCGTRFAQTKNEGEPITDLCKSCRNQRELFTHDEITKAPDHVPCEPE